MKKQIAIFIAALAIFIGATSCYAASEFVCAIAASGGDYTSLAAWQADIQCSLTASTTKVFTHSGITGSINKNDFVTGARSGATGTVVRATSTQILLISVSGTFVSDEQMRLNASNYVTLSTVGDSAIAVARIEGTWTNPETAPLAIDGWVTGGNNYVSIYAAPTAKHDGKWKSNAYRLEVTASANNTYAVEVKQTSTKIEGVQIKLINSGGWTGCAAIKWDPTIVAGSIQRCIIKGEISGAGSEGIGIYAPSNAVSGILTTRTNIIYDFINAACTTNIGAIKTGAGTATYSHYIVSNTLHNNYFGIYCGTGVVWAISNIIKGSGDTNTYIGDAFYTSSDYNTTDSADIIPGTGTHNLTGQTFSFVNEAGDDFHLLASDTGAHGKGGGMGTVVYDIENIPRPFPSGYPLDAGACEYGIVWEGDVSTNWEAGNNWVGGVKPDTSNPAIFNATSGAYNCALTAATSVGGIAMLNGYTGTISQGAYDLTIISGGFSQAGGTFTGGSGTMISGAFGQIFLLDGGTFNSPTGTLGIIPLRHYSGTADFDNGTVSPVGYSGIWTTYFLEEFNHLSFDIQYDYLAFYNTEGIYREAIVKGNLTITDGDLGSSTNPINLRVRGNVSVGAAGDLDSTSGTQITLDGTGDQAVTVASGGAFPSHTFTINKATGAATLTGTVGSAKPILNVNITQGALTFNPGTYYIDDASAITVGSGTTLNFTGTGSANMVTLRSSDAAAQWDLTKNGTVTADYVDVQYSNASAEVIATNSVGENNTNWTITGAISSATVVPATLVCGVTGNATASFTTQNAIPLDGKIAITFPSGFNVAGAGFSSATGIDGTLTPSVAGQVVTLTRSGGTSSAAGAKEIVLSGIKNPNDTGATGTYAIATKTAAAVSIDLNNSVTGSTIVNGGSLTSTNVQPASLYAAAVGNVDVIFTPANPLPADGKIEVTFPITAGAWTFNSGGTTAATSPDASIDGTFPVGIVGQVVTITRSGGTQSVSGAAKTIRLSYIKNPTTAGSTGTYTIKTASASGVTTGRIDQDTAVAADTIISVNVAKWDLNMSTGKLTLYFDSATNAATLTTTGITIQSSASASPSATYTLTGGTGNPASGTLTTGSPLEITLTTTDLNNIKATAGLAKDATTSYLSITTATIQDTSGNTVNAITPASAMIVTYNGGTYTADSAAPTFDTLSAASVNAVGDTLTLVFSEPMDTTTLNTTAVRAGTNIKLYNAIDAGGSGKMLIPASNATLAWSNQNMTATITLDEATDGAWMPYPDASHNYPRVEISGSAVKDAGGAYLAAINKMGASFSGETTAPVITVTAQYNAGADDTVTITSNEALQSSAGTLSNWSVYYDNDRAAGGETQIVTTNATCSLDSTKKIVTITLNEVTDGAYLPNGKYIKVVPNAANIKDLAGNANVSAVWSVDAVSGDTAAPTYTVSASSVHGGGDTVALTFNETMDTTTLTNANLATNLSIYTMDTIGTPSPSDQLVLTNATVSWDATKRIATVTLDEDTDEAYIGNGKYVVVKTTAAAVKDLAGNAAAASYVYYPTSGGPGEGVAKESTAPAFTVTAPSASSTVNHTRVSYSLDETLASGTITWTRTGGTADAGSPHAQSLTGSELHKGAHSNITLTNAPTLVSGAIYTVAFNGTDFVNNTATTVSRTGVTYDNTAPSVQSVSVASNNATTTLAKAGNTVTYSITYNEAVTAAVLSASTANNISTAVTQDVSASNSSSDSIVFTVASPDTGAITPNNINFRITDTAGNQATITSLGTITGSVTADTTLPTCAISVYLTSDPDTPATAVPETAAGGLIIKLIFNEAMKTSVTPTVSYNPVGATGPQSCTTNGTWSTTTYTNDTYSVKNDYAITPSTGDGAAVISVTNAQDLASNTMAADTNDTFNIVTTIFTLTGIADPITAGTTSTITVTAKDNSGNTRTDYRGIAHFTSSDPNILPSDLPSDYQFTVLDSGVHTFTNAVTLKTAGERSVTATDTVNAVITGSQINITVQPAATSKYTLNAPADIPAGSRAAYTVTRKDQYDNVTTNGTEVVYLFSNSTSSSKAFKNAASGGSTVTTITLGNGDSAANFWYYDEKVGTYTITVSDNSPADGTTNIDDASDSISVTPAATYKFKITAPDVISVLAGAETTITITAYDQYDNTATSYAGVDKSLIFSGASNGPTTGNPQCRDNGLNFQNFGVATVMTFTAGAGTTVMKLVAADETAHIKATAGSIATSDTEDLDVQVTGGAASALFWYTQPKAYAVANAPWAQFVIKVSDGYGNIASSSTASVTITPSSSPATISGNTVTASSGLAVFNSFKLTYSNYPATGLTLTASSTGLTSSAASSAVQVDEKYKVLINIRDNSNVSGSYPHLSDITYKLEQGSTTVIPSTTGAVSPLKSSPELDPGGTLDTALARPYGTSYIISLTKQGYVDSTENFNTDSVTDGGDGTYDNKIALTYYMTSVAEATADYAVKSSFVYDEDNLVLNVKLWLEKRGKLVLNTANNILGTATISVRDDVTGAWLSDVTLDGPSEDNKLNGTFTKSITAATSASNLLGAALVAGRTYFVKCAINYGGTSGTAYTYEGGTTFTVTITQKLSKDIIDKMGVAAGQTVAGIIGSVQTNIESAVSTAQSNIESAVSASETAIKAKVAAVKSETADILTAAQTTIPAKITTAQTALTNIVKSQILNTESAVQSGDALVVRFRTYTGLTPTITVYDPSNVKKVNGASMTEITGTGIYAYSLTFSSSWGQGDFTVVCSESTNSTMDAMTITVLSTDLEDVAGQVAGILGTTSNITSLKAAADTLTSQFSVLETVLNKLSSDLTNQVQEATSSMSVFDSVFSQLTTMSTQLKQMAGESSVNLEKLYNVSKDKKDDMVYLKNKTQELKAAMELSQKMIDNVANKPVTQTWYEYRE